MRNATQCYIDRLAEQAREAFAQHQIVARGDGRWRFGRPSDSLCWFEVVSLSGGALLVGGDIDYLVFAHYSDTQDPIDKVCWLGRQRDVDYYVAQKATIGMASDALVRVIDRDVLAHDLGELLKESWSGAKREALEGAIEELQQGEDESIVLHGLYRAPFDFEDLPRRLGMVPSPRLIFAHQALVRAADLLRPREGT